MEFTLSPDLARSPAPLLAIKTQADLIPQTATAARDALLEGARNLEAVSGERSQQLALGFLKQLQEASGAVEDSRKKAKDPFFKIGKLIDGAAKEFVEQIDKEILRIKRLLSEYQRKVEEAAREEERRRQEELARIEAEERAAAKAIEAARAEIDSRGNTAAAETQIAAQTQAMERLALQAGAALVPAEVKKAEGSVVRKTWKFRVIDIHALYRARPDLVSVEPRTAEVNKVIREANGTTQLPGIETYQDIDVSAR